MIVYDLSCEQAHRFEGWFSSAQDFDQQVAQDQVSCPVCGSVHITRELSAPYVNTGGSAPVPAKPAAETAVSGVDLEQLHRKFIQFVLKNSEDVGKKFPEEARKIHYEEEPRRSIRGEASRDEVEALREEGIDVYQLPGIATPPDQVH
jgi:hypothetical protein